MAWNPEPRVQDCRDIARKWGGKKQVIIIALDNKGAMDIATYGETKQLCTVAWKLGNVGLNAINDYIGAIDANLEGELEKELDAKHARAVALADKLWLKGVPESAIESMTSSQREIIGKFLSEQSARFMPSPF